jgi:predicted RNase H-like HicB family nuclease
LNMKFTAIIEQGESGWFVGQIEEVPAAISQGETIEKLKANLLDALRLILDTNKEITEKEYSGKQVIIEELELT